MLYRGDGGKLLCLNAGAYEATMDSTWRSANITGVFIRLLWKDLQPTPGTYDFTVLRREMDQAVRNGKLFSVGVKAGDDGTPDWIFSTNSNGSARSDGGGVPRLRLQDAGENTSGCGNRMDLGSPHGAAYKKHYFAMLTEVANLIKTRLDWYRALAYVKISGANLVSHENRLPNTCESGCPCNTEIFAADGYRPSNLYAFYDEQNQLLRTLFPGKALSYALIQDGFPRVNETGGYRNSANGSSNGAPLPAPSELTETILNRGQANHGLNFVVQHNGLQPRRSTCNLAGIHPKPNLPLESYWPVGGGCPNRWVVKEGAEGQITGYQTVNRAGVNTTEELDSSFDNLFAHTDAIFLEIYEELGWLTENTNRGLLPSGKPLGNWTSDLHRRRVDPVFPNFTRAGNPFPSTHSYTFTQPGPRIYYFAHGSKCGKGNQEWGAIIVDAAPPAVKAGGVVSALAFGGATAAAPGSWIEIYGSNLATATRAWAGSDFNGANAPTSLEGTSVRIAGQRAFVSYVSPGQINAQIPSNVPAGTQPLIVETPLGTAAPYSLNIQPAVPSLLSPASFRINGRQYAAALFADGTTFVLPPDALPGVPSRSARAGDTILLYGIGFGAVTPPQPAGQIVSQSNALALPLQVSIGGTAAATTYAGLAPGQIGLYQFNLTVPQVPAGDAVPLTFTLNGVAGTQTLFTAVQ
jgi:uncharacterized protein (TIGR03437 family)